ncbi:hypothetical protein GQ600_18034 [Phytophthora cactorum]|nr:hypothetical protein GQ600_18034 [Phytophthora cactorum]
MVGMLLVITRMLRARNQVINFWRLNGLEVDANFPGNEFAADDSVSILSTAPVLPLNALPLGVWVAVICGVVLRKAAHTPKQRCKMELFGMLACLRVKHLANQTTVEMMERKRGHPWMLTQVPTKSAPFDGGNDHLAAGWTASTWRQLPDPRPPCLQMELVAKLLACEQANVFRHSGVIVAGLTLWLSQAAFFALGNSHLVTTIDISQSYHGLSSYSQSLVGALTFVSVFSGPLVYFVNLFQWLDATSVTH